MARCFRFWILEVEVMYYLSSENKGADQLGVNRAADLRLCFGFAYGKTMFSHEAACIFLRNM